MGQAFASEIKGEFLDADDFHSGESLSKMASGIALTDEACAAVS